MDIYLTPEGKSRIRYPMLPEKITLGADAKFMTYSIISSGDIKIPRGKGIEEISYSGFSQEKPEKESRLSGRTRNRTH